VAGNATYGQARKLAAAKAREYSLVSDFKYGYRNLEDITNLPPGVLIKGSQNVFTNVNERVQIRQGYLLDGPSSSVVAPIMASYDWLTRGNGEVHMRAGNLTSAANDGKLQYRYENSGVVTWRDLATGLISVSYNFAPYWNTTESLREVLYVNGSPEVYRWNGAVTTILASTSASISKTGSTWSDAGFYVSESPRAITISGISYTYTGGEGTTTLTGVTPDASALTPGAIAHQTPITKAISSFTNGPPSTFKAGLISTLNNQVYLGSLTSSALWISMVNSYTVYTQNTPRQTGDGASLILDQNLVALEPQENYMYVSAGQDLWYNVSFQIQTSTVGVTYEQVSALPLKTGRQQGALSQAFVSHMKNDIILATNETTIDTFGRIETSLATPQQVNISNPIKLDIDSYDFTDGSIFYFQYQIFVAVPKEGLVLIYSLNTKSWAAPQTIPVSRFYVVNGELYGHSYGASESYKLFTGYADRVYAGFLGYPIPANMTFSFENYGTRSTLKSATGLYVEGYISENTVLTAGIQYELDGCATVKNFTINGSDNQIVCIPSDQGSLGKASLGKVKLGGTGININQNPPPKFRVEKTFNNTDFFEASCSFSCSGTNQSFQLLAFGLNARPSTQEPVSIRQ
jgi:hypothetical protein